MALNYLLDPMFQIENSAGKPATDGWLEVYVHGTREKYYCASNFDGTLHPFKIKLDSLGSNIVLAEDYQSYDVYAYNRFGSLLMSRYNVQPGSGGGGGIVTGEMQHWLGMYGPTYTNFPGDLAGHTLGIPRQSVDYVGDFIDRIENTSYPDGDVPAYIYLKPGLYHIDCVIRYQQDTGDIKNTLDEVLVYTGHGNANEDVAYQLDASGPETNGNRHCLKQSFIRKVTDSDGEVLYFAPGTPTDWQDAYIQTLNIVKLDSFALNGATMLSKVHHDETMTGDGTPDNPLSIQDALDGKQDTLTGGNGITIINNIVNIDSDSVQEKLTPGEGITIDSDGVISTEGRMYTEGWGIDIDNDNNVISADPEEVQKKLTAGVGINLDSDGNISGNYRGGYNIEVTGNTINKLGHKLIATNNISYTYCKVFDFTWQYVYGRGQTVFTATHYGGNFVTFSVTLIRAVGTSYTVAWPYVVAASPNMIKPTAFIEKLEIRESGNRIIGYLKLRNFSQDQFWLDWEGHSDAGYVTFTPQLTNSPEGEIAWTCEVSNHNVPYYQDDINSNFQQKLTAGDNINIDSDGVISATVPETAQADWTETDSSDPSYIQNKPTPKTLEAGSGVTITEGPDSITISAEGRTYTAGHGIDIDSDGNVSVDTDEIQEKLTPGENINIDSDGVISAELPEEEEVEFEEIDLDDYQTKLTAGQNITIDSDGVISAETSENNLFIAHVNETTYDEIKAALDAGKIVVALDGRIQLTVCSNWTDMWSQPAVLFGRMTDQYQGGFPARTLWSCRKDGNNTVWTRHYNNDALASKSDLNNKQDKLTAGDGITIINNIISVDSDSVQEKLTAGEGINIDSDGTISVDLPPITPLIAGDGVTIVDSQEGVVISAEGRSYTAGEGITIDSDGVISVDLPPVAPLVAGDNISIVDSDGSVVISATGGGSSYTAGTGIDINSDGIISVDQSTVAMQSDLPEEEEVEFEEIDLDDYQTKLTAGQNITIDSDGVISATGGGGTQVQSDWDEEDSEEPSYIQNKPTPKTLVAGQNVTITESSNAITISAADAPTYTAGQNIEIDSDGVISAELPDEEEVDFEEVDLDDYQTKLTAGSGINIDSDGIISNTMTVDQTYDATSSNPQSGTAVAEAVATKEDEFDAGDGLEFTTDSDGNRVLQVEGPVDVVAGPGIVIDNPDGNTLRISVAQAEETVLYDANGSPNQSGPWTLSEVPTNFEWIDIVLGVDAAGTEVKSQRFKANSTYMKVDINRTDEDPYWKISTMTLIFNQTTMSIKSNSIARVLISSAGSVSVSTNAAQAPYIYQVIGVHRIANN